VIEGRAVVVIEGRINRTMIGMLTIEGCCRDRRPGKQNYDRTVNVIEGRIKQNCGRAVVAIEGRINRTMIGLLT
jgi:hypothetical protein